MKKIFGLIIICSVLVLPVFAATPVNFDNSGNHPLSATDIHLVKKVPLPPVIGEVKGNPHGGPPGKNGESGSKEQAATGTLGNTEVGNKYAIIIGICDYPDGKRNYDLCISDGDSLRMHQTLTQLYGYATSNIALFKDGGNSSTAWFAQIPTKDNILRAINDLRAKVTSSDEVVFFFSGHGADGLVNDGDKERRDEGIVVHDSDDGEVDGNSQIDIIWDGELKTAFSGFATDRIVFVFDSCLAGGMNDVASEGRVISMGTSETSVSYVYSSDLLNVREDEMEDVDENGQLDGEGVFTRYFVNKGMLQGNANVHNYVKVEGDEPATIEEAFDYAKEIIPSIWKRQKPTISDDFIDDLLL
ncbi:caspase family protein [Candidatus Parcubacteria bacterium]|nr:caspase family protein [Candidatus Parcubacteria bacterium]